ncbi:hypothetical protein QR680_011014 [Steinernema hermaphroditum]|uniref:Uncharacterized protein n=1 Tax=Steinernema hermaphroditum TaxID=289476 RepID=A0AA39ISB8_9BILA|nr:hypothetical protein QR680_011014 [Steinernema hermaphroditum]
MLFRRRTEVESTLNMFGHRLSVAQKGYINGDALSGDSIVRTFLQEAQNLPRSFSFTIALQYKTLELLLSEQLEAFLENVVVPPVLRYLAVGECPLCNEPREEVVVGADQLNAHGQFGYELKRTEKVEPLLVDVSSADAEEHLRMPTGMTDDVAEKTFIEVGPSVSGF